MAKKVIVTKSKLNAIGDAIRTRIGEKNKYTLDEMAEKILSISGEPDPNGSSLTSKIYGVQWNGLSGQKWTRTNASANFEDPVPAENNGEGSSPFDDIYPWSEMNIVNDAAIGTAVKIPKFYYKWTIGEDHDIKLQITDSPTSGFSICPACADRGDGRGERDYVLIGRYKCTNAYLSTSGGRLEHDHYIETFRNGVHNLNEKAWICDASIYETIWMLYLVEFANWNSQAMIGKGSINVYVGITATGYTDNMQYHTGTTGLKTELGGTQYRNIEGIWDNAFEFCDGIYIDENNNIYMFKDPTQYNTITSNEISGGTLVGKFTETTGFIRYMNISNVKGFEWFMFPTNCNGASENTYIGDNVWEYGNSSSGTKSILSIGGQTESGHGVDSVPGFGLFHINRSLKNISSTWLTARPMLLK